MALWILSLVAASIGVAFWIYQRFGHLLKYGAKIPGYPAFPVIGNALEYVNKTPHEFLESVGENFAAHGKTFRVWMGPDLMVVSKDARVAEAVLSSQKFLDKSNEYDFLRPWLANGLLTSTGRKWHSRRKIITPTFHFKILEQFVEIFDRQSSVFVEKLRPHAVSEEAFDIYPLVTLCALDVICESAMGTKVNAQEDAESEYVRAVKDMSYIVHQRTFKILARMNFTFNLMPYRGVQEQALKVLHGYTDSVIKSRRRELGATSGWKIDENDNDIGIRKKVAFLDMLLATTVDGKPLEDLEIREEVDTFMFEGHDTTTSAISFLFRCLAENPKVQAKVYEEILTVIGNDVSRPVTLQVLNDLNYLDLVIKETLRLYPSVPAYARNLKEDMIVGKDITIPAGCNLVVVPFYMGRDADYFERPNEFWPERFATETSAEKANPYRYVPFSAGPRNCVGQKFAVAEIKSLVSKTLRHYEVLPVGAARAAKTGRFVAELILRDEGGVPVRLRKRV
ncbi:cytochrome P450 4d1-like [Uranotaenia lowii]|uniref:cytochrome P450 4d1-like n=1 Tax=Uranotaenia lowii TaxID=190385 RepID=UPI00247AA41E|nr:cytochrome P450 4d1-like [Uranotaenia lowii]